MTVVINAGRSAMTKAAAKTPTARTGRKRAMQRGRILHAAIREFAARGYERTTMQDIANALDMTGASVYYYFKTKDELLFAALNSVLLDLIEALNLALQNAKRGAKSRLRAMIEAHIAFELNDPTLGPLVNAHLYGPRYLVETLTALQRAKLRRHQRTIYELYRGVVQDGIDSGAFAVVDPALATFDLLAIAQYPVVWFRPGGRLTIDMVRQRQSDIAVGLLSRSTNGPKTR